MVITGHCGFLILPKGIPIQLKKLDCPNKTYLPKGYQFASSERKESQKLCKKKCRKHSGLGIEAVQYVGKHGKKIYEIFKKSGIG